MQSVPLFQASEAHHDRLYSASGGGGSSPPRWGSSSAGSSGSGGASGPAVSEKRQHSPLHHPAASDYDEDSLDGAPAAKRARGTVAGSSAVAASGSGSVKGRLSKKSYAPAAPVAPSGSRMAVAGSALEEEELEEEEMMEEEEDGYNSEDEYSYSHVGVNLTEEEWAEKDRRWADLVDIWVDFSDVWPDLAEVWADLADVGRFI